MRRHHAAASVTIIIVTASACFIGCVQPPPAESRGALVAPTATTQRAGFAVAGSVSANRIARPELDSVSATTLADAIARLRPAWLRVQRWDPLLRDDGPSVFIDETFV